MVKYPYLDTGVGDAENNSFGNNRVVGNECGEQDSRGTYDSAGFDVYLGKILV
jgi:hypothetical protein